VTRPVGLDIARDVLHTERLDLLPLSLEVCEAVLAEDRDRASELLGIDLGEWPREAEWDGAFPGYVMALRGDPSMSPWLGRAIVLRERGLAIGSVNLKGRPTREGRVEIGYGLIDAFHGHGYAREAVTALLAWVFAHPEVREVVAEIEPDNRRSVHLAESLGFVATGAESTQHDAHEIWRLTREAYEQRG
jgi:[ribosomal protein S5]-alanine N-acetyltransferase